MWASQARRMGGGGIVIFLRFGAGGTKWPDSKSGDMGIWPLHSHLDIS